MRSKRPDRETERSFVEDERAIEGLPIRLVIALVVGVASLAIMMQVLGTFEFGADQEVDIEFENAVVPDDGSSYTVTVVDAETGDPIPEADVIVRGDTLSIVEPYTNSTNDDGELSFTVGDGSSNDVNTDFRTTQETGKIRFEVVPPADSPYTDDQANEKMTVIDEG